MVVPNSLPSWEQSRSCQAKGGSACGTITSCAISCLIIPTKNESPLMRRKPNETVQVNLRIKEELRRKLERAAKEQEISLNQLIRARLEDSFEKKPRQSLESVASDIERNWDRFRELFLIGGVISNLKEANKILEEMIELVNEKDDPELSSLVHTVQALLRTKSLQQHGGKGGNA